MQFIRLKNQTDKFYNEAIALYERNFVFSERRDADEQRRIMQNDDYHFEIALQDDELCGFAFYWETPDYIFLEHLCVAENKRNQRIGHTILDYLKSKNKIIYLEIEPIVDETTAKRKRFYEDNGFFLNEHHHVQVKYHLDDDDLVLLVMTLGRTISKQEYDEFYDYMVQNVQIKQQNVDEITIAPATADDDFATIAELIYYSDVYIYPYLFEGVETGKRVISKMIERDTIYNYKNLMAAKCQGQIVGVLVYSRQPVIFSYDVYRSCFEDVGVLFDEKAQFIWENYYLLMQDDCDGIYLANACTASSCRGKGVATKLFQKVFEQDNHCYLECVQANVGAVKLYQKLGFEIMYEYPGVFGVPCFKMERRK